MITKIQEEIEQENKSKDEEMWGFFTDVYLQSNGGNGDEYIYSFFP